MVEFIKETDRISRLKVPFENIYTSVFLLKSKNGYMLVDCATYDSDVDEFIVPALKQVGLGLNDIKALILTHFHGDHSGGKKRILQINPQITIVDSERIIDLESFEIYQMKGHTLDCIGVLDKIDVTLISGDGLQGKGVGRYPCNVIDKQEYFNTIDKVKKDKKIQKILFSHEYEPWCKDVVVGREEIEKCLEDCLKNC